MASGVRVLRVTAVESEAELPFAALHVLLRPALDEVGTIPGRQAAALRGAFGLTEEAVADRFLVGLGVLSLIAELAEGRPVLLLVDDAHWLDRASAERLLASEGLALAIRDQLIAEAAGNPLALIELARGLSAGERAGSITPLPLTAASAAGRVQGAFLVRVTALPAASRRAVLVAALGGMADLAQISRAIAAGGGSIADLAAAERAGLLRVTPAGGSFSHPRATGAAPPPCPPPTNERPG
jgi:hypothetical protein